MLKLVFLNPLLLLLLLDFPATYLLKTNPKPKLNPRIQTPTPDFANLLACTTKMAVYPTKYLLGKTSFPKSNNQLLTDDF